MSDNLLIAKIKADAEKVAADILSANQSEVAKIEKDTAAKLSTLQKEHATALKKQHDQLELVAMSQANQAGKIAVQQAKRNRVDAIIDSAMTELATQSSADYVAYFGKMVSSAVPKAASVVSVSAPSERVAETNDILAQAGLAGEVAADKDIAAGLIIETADGVYDLTLNRLLKEKRPEIEMEMVKQVMV